MERPSLPQERNSAQEGKIDNQNSYPARQKKFDVRDDTQSGNATSEPIKTKVRTSWRWRLGRRCTGVSSLCLNLHPSLCPFLPGHSSRGSFSSSHVKSKPSVSYFQEEAFRLLFSRECFSSCLFKRKLFVSSFQEEAFISCSACLFDLYALVFCGTSSPSSGGMAKSRTASILSFHPFP